MLQSSPVFYYVNDFGEAFSSMREDLDRRECKAIIKWWAKRAERITE
jgi:hypothetical protein